MIRYDKLEKWMPLACRPLVWVVKSVGGRADYCAGRCVQSVSQSVGSIYDSNGKI
jgi:hypothetical protein